MTFRPRVVTESKVPPGVRLGGSGNVTTIRLTLVYPRKAAR